MSRITADDVLDVAYIDVGVDVDFDDDDEGQLGHNVCTSTTQRF